MKIIASTSGGKDSTFALFKAMQMGHEIAYLANTIAYDSGRVRFHGVRAEIIQKQAEALGIPLLQKETTPENYRKEYIDNIKDIIQKESIEGLCLGDIFLEDCYTWAKEICDELGIELIEPLWKISPEEIMKDFINSGFEAVVVSTQANLLGEDWVGRKLDLNFLEDIKKLKGVDPDLIGVDICGENGEYHSLVLNGPIFKKKLEIKKSKKVLINGYWFLDLD